MRPPSDRVESLLMNAFYRVVENFVEGREDMATSLAKLPPGFRENLSTYRLHGSRPFLHFASTPEEVEVFYKSGEKPKAGIDEKYINVEDTFRRTWLNSLIVRRKPEAVYALLRLASKKLDLTTPDRFGNTPLDNAMKQGYFELRNTMLNILQGQNKHDEVEKHRIKVHDELEKREDKGIAAYNTTLLHIESDPEHIKELLKMGCDPNIRNSEGQTVFSAFIIQGNLEAAYKLLDLEGEKVDVSTPDIDGFTPLWYAMGEGYLDLVQRILECLKTQNKLHVLNGKICYLLMACRLAPELVRTFLNYGAKLIVEVDIITRHWNLHPLALMLLKRF